MKRQGCFDPFRLFCSFAEGRGSDEASVRTTTRSLVWGRKRGGGAFRRNLGRLADAMIGVLQYNDLPAAAASHENLGRSCIEASAAYSLMGD